MTMHAKITALQEYTIQANDDGGTYAEQAAHAAGMVHGLKTSMKAGFNYDNALMDASLKLQELLEQGASEMAIDRAIGYFSGIVFAETDDVFEAQAAGYQEKEALKEQLRQMA